MDGSILKCCGVPENNSKSGLRRREGSWAFRSVCGGGGGGHNCTATSK